MWVGPLMGAGGRVLQRCPHKHITSRGTTLDRPLDAASRKGSCLPSLRAPAWVSPVAAASSEDCSAVARPSAALSLTTCRRPLPGHGVVHDQARMQLDGAFHPALPSKGGRPRHCGATRSFRCHSRIWRTSVRQAVTTQFRTLPGGESPWHPAHVTTCPMLSAPASRTVVGHASSCARAKWPSG
jgi:hypothetical protein